MDTQQIFRGGKETKAKASSKKPSKANSDDDSDDDGTSEVDKKRLAMYEKSKLRCGFYITLSFFFLSIHLRANFFLYPSPGSISCLYISLTVPS